MYRIKTLLLLLLASFSIASAQQSAQETYSDLLVHYASPHSFLIGLADDNEEGSFFDLLASEALLMPFDERMRKSGNVYVGEFAFPEEMDYDQMTLIFDRLEMHSSVSYAHPILSLPNGGFRGISDQMVVKLSSPSDFGLLQSMAADEGIIDIRVNEFLPNWYHLSVKGEKDPLLLSLEWQEAGRFASVEPDYIWPAEATVDDTWFHFQWALENNGTSVQGSGTPGADMDVVNAWTYTTGDPSIVIGILDSGIDTLHPDLMDNLLPGYDATGGGSNGYPNTDYPNDGHGTACAGIAAAKGNNGIGIAGVCYDCGIIPVKVFYYTDFPGFGLIPYSTGTYMANAISWASANGADVLSNSWGVTDDAIFLLPDGTAIVDDAIAAAAPAGRGGLGLPMFFSSGNEGDPPIWPGRNAEAISVNATSMCDERKFTGSCDGESWEGNWGDDLDVSAPGVRIYTTDMLGGEGFSGNDYVNDFNGTSAACPNAAGVMGLILSMNPSFTLAEARAVMETSCERTGGYDYSTVKANGEWSSELGYGRVNAFQAMIAASNDPAPSLNDLGLTIYPNPTNGNIWLEIQSEQLNTLEWALSDLNGRQLDSGLFILNSGVNKIKCDAVSNRSEGLYLMSLKNQNNSQVVKIVICP